MAAALGSLAVLLGAAGGAGAQSTTPDELWREYPLEPRTQAPPAVPALSGERDARARGRRVPPGRAEEGGGVPWLAVGAGLLAVLIAGAVVAGLWLRRRWARLDAAPAIAVPDRTVVAIGPARIARRGGERGDVVARIAPSVQGPGPVYEIVWHHDAERSGFELAAVDCAGVLDVPRSPAAAWRVPGSPPNVASLRALHAEFCAALRDAGWTPAGTGETWYGQRVRAPARGRIVAASRRSNTRPFT
jgi:hypothetical protein